MSESQCSCIFQELINRVKYAYLGLKVKYALGKSSCVSKITPVPQKNRRITVFVSLPTLQLTALLLKSFRPRLHGYTLVHVSRSLSEMYTCRVIHLSRSRVEVLRCLMSYRTSLVTHRC